MTSLPQQQLGDGQAPGSLGPASRTPATPLSTTAPGASANFAGSNAAEEILQSVVGGVLQAKEAKLQQAANRETARKAEKVAQEKRTSDQHKALKGEIEFETVTDQGDAQARRQRILDSVQTGQLTKAEAAGEITRLNAAEKAKRTAIAGGIAGRARLAIITSDEAGEPMFPVKEAVQKLIRENLIDPGVGAELLSKVHTIEEARINAVHSAAILSIENDFQVEVDNIRDSFRGAIRSDNPNLVAAVTMKVDEKATEFANALFPPPPPGVKETPAELLQRTESYNSIYTGIYNKLRDAQNLALNDQTRLLKAEFENDKKLLVIGAVSDATAGSVFGAIGDIQKHLMQGILSPLEATAAYQEVIQGTIEAVESDLATGSPASIARASASIRNMKSVGGPFYTTNGLGPEVVRIQELEARIPVIRATSTLNRHYNDLQTAINIGYTPGSAQFQMDAEAVAEAALVLGENDPDALSVFKTKFSVIEAKMNATQRKDIFVRDFYMNLSAPRHLVGAAKDWQDQEVQQKIIDNMFDQDLLDGIAAGDPQAVTAGVNRVDEITNAFHRASGEPLKLLYSQYSAMMDNFIPRLANDEDRNKFNFVVNLLRGQGATIGPAMQQNLSKQGRATVALIDVNLAFNPKLTPVEAYTSLYSRLDPKGTGAKNMSDLIVEATARVQGQQGQNFIFSEQPDAQGALIASAMRDQIMKGAYKNFASTSFMETWDESAGVVNNVEFWREAMFYAKAMAIFTSDPEQIGSNALQAMFNSGLQSGSISVPGKAGGDLVPYVVYNPDGVLPNESVMPQALARELRIFEREGHYERALLDTFRANPALGRELTGTGESPDAEWFLEHKDDFVLTWDINGTTEAAVFNRNVNSGYALVVMPKVDGEFRYDMIIPLTGPRGGVIRRMPQNTEFESETKENTRQALAQETIEQLDAVEQ